MNIVMRASLGICALALVTSGASVAKAKELLADPDREGAILSEFRDPPDAARPMTYMMVLNAYVNRKHVKGELEQYRDAGIAAFVCSISVPAGERKGVRRRAPRS